MPNRERTRRPGNRSAFTLIELLVVIGILLVLSTLTYAVFGTGRNSDKTRSAARIAQSAFLGAKDRALHAKDLRGIRLTRDNNGPTFASGSFAIANGFVFLQPLPLQSTGNIGTAMLKDVAVIDPTGNGLASNATEIVISGQQAQSWHAQDQAGIWPSGMLQVRIQSGQGQWYQLAKQSNTPPYWFTTDPNNNLNLRLQTPLVAGLIGSSDPRASIDIQLGNDMLPFHQPITLPSGVIIDLAASSVNVQAAAGNSANLDIMFSPRGNVSGPVAGIGPLHFLIRGLKDATVGVNPWAVGSAASPNPDLSQGDRLILSVFPQTGLVQTFEIDPTDHFTNPSLVSPISYPGTGGPDGIADNLFNFAQQGKSAGR